MDAEYLPILVIVALVLYPFATLGITAFIVSRSGRTRFLLPTAIPFALAGCIPPVWFFVTYGLGPIPPVTIMGAIVFVSGAAATGSLLGAIVELFVPVARKAANSSNGLEVDRAHDDNPYAPPRSENG